MFRGWCGGPLPFYRDGIHRIEFGFPTQCRCYLLNLLFSLFVQILVVLVCERLKFSLRYLYLLFETVVLVIVQQCRWEGG